jgi:hypothetical protein
MRPEATGLCYFRFKIVSSGRIAAARMINDRVEDLTSALDGSPEYGHGYGASWSDRLRLYQRDSL